MLVPIPVVEDKMLCRTLQMHIFFTCFFISRTWCTARWFRIEWWPLHAVCALSVCCLYWWSKNLLFFIRMISFPPYFDEGNMQVVKRVLTKYKNGLQQQDVANHPHASHSGMHNDHTLTLNEGPAPSGLYSSFSNAQWGWVLNNMPGLHSSSRSPDGRQGNWVTTRMTMRRSGVGALAGALDLRRSKVSPASEPSESLPRSVLNSHNQRGMKNSLVGAEGTVMESKSHPGSSRSRSPLEHDKNIATEPRALLGTLNNSRLLGPRQRSHVRLQTLPTVHDSSERQNDRQNMTPTSS